MRRGHLTNGHMIVDLEVGRHPEITIEKEAIEREEMATGTVVEKAIKTTEIERGPILIDHIMKIKKIKLTSKLSSALSSTK